MLIKCQKIFILLGDDCNLACRYCIQHPLVRVRKSADVPPELLEWIDREAELADGMLDICFFGGEPLLYFDALKTIVGCHRAENVQYHMITNGKALTEEMVSFFNAHHVYLNISWDGDRVKETRGYDVFEKNRDNLLKLDCLGVNAVVSSKAYPCDVLKAMQKIDDAYYALHRRHIKVHTDFIFGCDLPDPSLSDGIDYEKLNEQVKRILAEYDKFARGGTADPVIIQWMTFYLEGYLWAMSHDESPYCQNGRGILNVDLKGNLYFCHNTRQMIGTIWSRNDRYTTRVDALESGVERQKSVCSQCPAYRLCRICCKLIPPDKLEEHYCKLRRAVFMPMAEYIEHTLAGYAKEGKK